MSKRKRETSVQNDTEDSNVLAKTPRTSGSIADPVSIQIVTGSYERVLHGFVAQIQPQADNADGVPSVRFSDTFLFAAHSSSIRCVALSQNKESKKCILATGGSDERINLYSISTAPPSQDAQQPSVPSLSATAILENKKNKELGSLMHHSRAITKLYFPTAGKLFSASEDNTIGITRTRDWTVLSAMKAPIPKPVGRPSGDTAAPGEVPAGVNDFAVHPSMKIMMSVGKGEKCMRLWNLVTGKKAGALNFGRDLLRQVGEGRFGAGEGQKILWSGIPDGSDAQAELVVCFERAAALFGEDCEPKAIMTPLPATKLHDLQTVPGNPRIAAISTEDGRVLFFSHDYTEQSTEELLPVIKPFAQIGGPTSEAASTRIKTLTFVEVSNLDNGSIICITGSSDGCTRLWLLTSDCLVPPPAPDSTTTDEVVTSAKQIGRLLATYQSGNRITCLGAFVMDAPEVSKQERQSKEPEDFAGFSSEAEEH